MDKWQAIDTFWNSFGLTAYEENAVPKADDVSFPYITYQAMSSTFDNDVSAKASIWTRSDSWQSAANLADQIETALKDGGQVLHYSGGIIWVTADSPFAQNMGDPDDNRIKRKLLSIVYHFA